MSKKNSSGSAVVMAVLMVVVLIASMAGVALIYDKNSINDNNNLPALADSSEEQSSAEISSEEKSSEEEIPVVKVDYPEKAENYEEFENEDFTAKFGVLIDVDNNEIVAGKNYNRKMYPASLTKVMTLLVAVENIQDMSRTYTFSYDEIHELVVENASRADFGVDETVTVTDLLYGTILVSGADGTLGLANIVAGSEEAFVEMMNEKADEMGLKNTHFSNASGLHHKEHYSTAQDMAVILKTALENETCREILSAKEYITSKTTQHPEGIILRSLVAQRLVDYYVTNGGEILGGKTGFTDEAKHALATFYEYNGKTYVCVTSKSKDMWKAVEDSIMLYENFAAGDRIETSEETSENEAL